MGVDQDNGALDQCLGSDQLVVGGVVGDVQDTYLAGAYFGAPGEVSAVQTKGPELEVSSAATDLVDTRFSNLGHGRRTSHFKLAFLLELGTASSGLPAFVAAFASDTLGLS